MTDVTDERWLREAFNDIAGAAAVDPEADRPVAWHALRRRTRRRSQRRLGAITALTAIAVVVAFVAWPSAPGQLVDTVPASPLPKLEVVTTIEGAFVEPAYDGHDVWTVRGIAGVSGGGTAVERRDADSGRLLASIHVEEMGVRSIAADGAGSVWLVDGGGESLRLRITRIDVSTERVVFTHTVSESCYCSIVSGAEGTWLAGGSSGRALRIDPRTGAIEATISLPGGSSSLALVGGRVQVGLDDSRVAVIDPGTNRVERVLTLEGSSRPPAGAIISVEPVRAGPGVGNSWVTRGDGRAFSIVANDHVASRRADLLRPIGILSATLMGDRLWAVGVNQLLFDAVDGTSMRGFSNYDHDRASFGPIIERRKRFVASPSEERELAGVVAAGTALWILDENGPRILVVQT